MRKIFVLLIVFSVCFLFAQRDCGTDNRMKEFYAKNPEMITYGKELQKFLQNPNNIKRSNRISGFATISVVVHVLYKNETQNISDEQILSQIEVLNKDFRKLNEDYSTVVPEEFKSYGADLGIAFCMATRDPNGNATNGIVRKSVSASFNFDNDYYKSSGDLAWDNEKYLNIWVGEFANISFLGSSSTPVSAGNDDDGIAINYKFFGTKGTATYPFNKGRTTTHEIGHYLGLNHPWGSNGSKCGATDNDDGVEDTPGTNASYLGCPTFPDLTNVCNTVKYPNGAMFMNFMDYVDDACMAFFTLGQKVITSNTLSSVRVSLLNSYGCSEPSFYTPEKSKKVKVFPNPASEYVTISSPNGVFVNEIEFFDISGKLIFTKTNTQSQNKLNIDIKNLSRGLYFIRIYINGKVILSEKFIKK